MDHLDRRPEITVRPLDNDLHVSFERLLARNWQQTWPDELHRQIVDWRYYRRPPGHLTWVGCVDGECVAMIDSRVRPYLLRDRRVMVRETADWYVMPEYRQYSLGLAVLWKLKSYPEPVLVVGGTDATRRILPRLRWTTLQPVQSYVLPVTARGLTANMMRLMRPRHERLARLVWRGLPYRAPRRLPAPPGRAEMQLLANDDWHALPADASSELVQLLEQDHWRWVGSMPEALASRLGMVFRLDGAVAGFCLAQLEPSVTGWDGRIVHLQAGQNDPGLIGWIASTAARALADRGAEFIRCLVSTPEKSAAVRAAGFMLSKTIPCYWWGRPGVATPNSVDVGYLRGDDSQPLHALRGRYPTVAAAQDAA